MKNKFDKIQNPFNIIKSLKNRNRKTFYESDKQHEQKPAADITKIEEKARMFPLTVSTQHCTGRVREKVRVGANTGMETYKVFINAKDG